MNILTENTKKSANFCGLQNSGIMLPHCNNETSIVRAIHNVPYVYDIRLPVHCYTHFSCTHFHPYYYDILETAFLDGVVK